MLSQISNTETILPNATFFNESFSLKFNFNKSLDQDFLNEYYGPNLDFAKKMFSVFLESTPVDISKLTEAIEKSDFSNIVAIAHKIKNNFTWVGLSAIGIQMGEIERLAKNSDRNIAQPYSYFLESYISHLRIIKSDYIGMCEYLNS